MSERMIELQRAKLGLPPIARAPPAAAPATATESTTGMSTAAVAPFPTDVSTNESAHGSAPAAAASTRAPTRLTPQQAAASAMHAEDQKLQAFVQRLHERQDKSTVPVSLSRRMLQRQGVGYLDDTVASTVSASGDRFLATVLQQAVACRDQRIKGNELKRQESQLRRKHVEQHKADSDDRKRRKLDLDERKKKRNLAAIAAAETLKETGSTTAATAAAAAIDPTASKSKKKKKKTEGDNEDEDDELSDDSLDEEEEYYESYYGKEERGNESNEEDEEEESRYMLLLRDLERPLEAWNVHLTGKMGLGTVPLEITDGVENKQSQEQEEMVENGELNGKETKDASPKEPVESRAEKTSRPPTPAKSPTPKPA